MLIASIGSNVAVGLCKVFLSMMASSNVHVHCSSVLSRHISWIVCGHGAFHTGVGVQAELVISWDGIKALIAFLSSEAGPSVSWMTPGRTGRLPEAVARYLGGGDDDDHGSDGQHRADVVYGFVV